MASMSERGGRGPYMESDKPNETGDQNAETEHNLGPDEEVYRARVLKDARRQKGNERIRELQIRDARKSGEEINTIRSGISSEGIISPRESNLPPEKNPEIRRGVATSRKIQKKWEGQPAMELDAPKYDDELSPAELSAINEIREQRSHTIHFDKNGRVPLGPNERRMIHEMRTYSAKEKISPPIWERIKKFFARKNT